MPNFPTKQITIEQDYDKRIHKPMQMLLTEYDQLLDVSIHLSQHAEKFRKGYNRSINEIKDLERQNETLTNRCETLEAKHKIARQHFQKELKELNKFREQRDNFYEIIELCKDLLCNQQAPSVGATTDSDSASVVEQEIRKRFSVAQVNRLKSFNLKDLASEDFENSPINAKDRKLQPFTTPRFGRNLGVITESQSFEISFDSDPDEPDSHSTKIIESPKRKKPTKRYSSDAILSHSTVTDSSVAVGMDAGLYQAKKNVPAVNRRRPSREFRRRSVRTAMSNMVSEEGEPISPIAVAESPKKLKKRSRDITPNRKAPEAPSATQKKAKVTPPNEYNPRAIPVTPISRSELMEMKKQARKKHEWVHKTGIISGPKCQISGQKIKFNKAMWRCARCGMVVHPDAFDKAVKTECHAQLMKTPTASNLKKNVSQNFISGFTTRQHNILLIVEEIERRRMFVSEGIYRVSGNVKEKNNLVAKLKDANHSLRIKRQILATQCSDNNSLTSLLKHYLNDGEPILTYKLLPSLVVISTDDKLSASTRKESAEELIAKLPDSLQQILAILLRHFQRVIESASINKMSAENMARSVGPSLIGYKTPQPTARDYQTAPGYQRNCSLLLFSLNTIGEQYVLGRALKKLLQYFYYKNPI